MGIIYLHVFFLKNESGRGTVVWVQAEGFVSPVGDLFNVRGGEPPQFHKVTVAQMVDGLHGAIVKSSCSILQSLSDNCSCVGGGRFVVADHQQPALHELLGCL